MRGSLPFFFLASDSGLQLWIRHDLLPFCACNGLRQSLRGRVAATPRELSPPAAPRRLARSRRLADRCRSLSSDSVRLERNAENSRVVTFPSRLVSACFANWSMSGDRSVEPVSDERILVVEITMDS